MLDLRSRSEHIERGSTLSSLKQHHGGATKSRFDQVAPTKASVDFKCTFIISGKMYDLSSWANAHPGGATILKKYHGLDATNAFQRVGHSQYAVKLMQKFEMKPKHDTPSNSNDNPKQNNEPASPMEVGAKVVAASWREKVFTREDSRNIHKSLGLFVLLHYIYRYYQLLSGSDPSAGFGRRMGNGSSLWGFFCLLPHAALSLSSLMFHSVPKERIVGQPMIWQEFRAHSIIFALRSVIATGCGWVSIYFDHDPIIRKIAVIICSLSIIISICAAEEATRKLRVCNEESTTATMPYWDGCSIKTQRRFKSFYAYSQFLATLACLAMSNPSMSFVVMLPIQLAALLMTMVRKGFIGSKSYHLIYAASLVLPYVVTIQSMVRRKAFGNPAFVLAYLLYCIRCRGLGKYWIWVPLVVWRILFGDLVIKNDWD